MSARRTCSGPIALLLLLLAAVACTSTEERLARHLERGEQYLAEARVREALLEFKNALKLQPEDAALYERVGDVLRQNMQLGAARRHYEIAFRLDPNRIRAGMLEARLIAPEDPDRAHELLALGLERAPDLPVVQLTRAHLAILEDDFETAVAAAHRAIELEPDEVTGWGELGRVHQAQVRDAVERRATPPDALYQEALRAFDKVDQLEGGWPRARIAKGQVYALWPGHQEEAKAQFVDALELARAQAAPLEVRVAAEALEIYARSRRDTELRLRALRELVAVADDQHRAWDDLARLEGEGAEGAEERVYLDLLERRPEDARAHLLYTSYLERTGRGDDAAAHLRHAVERTPHPLLWGHLVRLSLRQGRAAEARALYAEMAEAYPLEFETRLAGARLALAAGENERALEELQTLVEDDESAELRRLQALAYYRLGTLRAADQAAARASELSRRPFFSALHLRARIAHDRGDWRRVLQSYREIAAAGQPLGSSEKVRLATALYETQRAPAARELLEEALAGERPPARAAVVFARYEGERQPDRASELLEAAHARAPADVDLLRVMTERDMAGGRAKPALERLDRVVAQGLARPPTLLLRAELLARLGAFDRAEADLLRAFEADPALPGAVDLLHGIYAAQDRLEEARRSFEQADAAGVLHAGARLLLARLYLADGDLMRTRDTLDRVVRELPDLWTAKNDLAFVLAELGEDLGRAQVLAREAHQASGRSPTTVDTVGYVHLRAGRAQAAFAAFRRAIALAVEGEGPVPPSYRYHLGLALQALDRPAEAAQAFEAALAAGDFPEAEAARKALAAARQRGAEPSGQS